jgi:hypothetical protein
VKFRDFDIVAPGLGGEFRELVRGSRAFVEAVVAQLAQHRVEAPWRKLAVEVTAAPRPPVFMPPLPKVGLSVASVLTELPNRALLETHGAELRPHLASLVVGTRDTVRAGSGWDDPQFWSIIQATGARVGPFEQRLPAVRERASGLSYHLTWEWDEAGTRQFLDVRRNADDAAPSGRALLNDFPGAWELFPGVVPTRLRLRGDAVDLLDASGARVTTVTKPTAAE